MSQYEQQRGSFIVLTGINRTGKSLQTRLLAEQIAAHTQAPCRMLKYPIYDLAPEGPRINAYLREQNPEGLTPFQFQLLQVENRKRFEPRLAELLENGTHVIAEDYTGTGIAWGMAAGIDKLGLVHMNRNLLREDLTILVDGEPFSEATEEGHTHESDDELTQRARQAFQELANDFGWITVNARQAREQVQRDIWEIVAPMLRTAS